MKIILRNLSQIKNNQEESNQKILIIDSKHKKG